MIRSRSRTPSIRRSTRCSAETPAPTAGDEEVDPATPTPPPAEGEGETPTAPVVPSDEVQALLNEAAQELQNKQAALAAGDWAAYGAADAKLAEIIASLLSLTNAQNAPADTGE